MFETIYSFFREYQIEGYLQFAVLSYTMYSLSAEKRRQISCVSYTLIATITYILLHSIIIKIFSFRFATFLANTSLPYWIGFANTIFVQLIFCILFFKDRLTIDLFYTSFFVAFIQLVKVCFLPLYESEATMPPDLYRILDTCHIALILLLLVLLSKMFQKHRIHLLSNVPFRLILAALYFPFVIIICYGVLLASAKFYSYIIPILSLILVTLIPLVYMFLFSMVKSFQEQTRLDQALVETKSQLARYRFSIELEERLKKERHELKNNYFYIQTLLKEQKYEKLNAYMDSVIGEKLEDLSCIQTGNTLMDYLINKKIVEAKRYNIKTYAEIIVPSQIAVSEDLLCTVLLNLLDNAIEASRKVTNPDIQISISVINAYLVCKISNKVDNEVLQNNPTLRTTKKDSANHGLGLKIIRESIEKANGILQISLENHYFIATSMLPMEEHPVEM